MLLHHPLNNLFPFPSLLTELSKKLCVARKIMNLYVVFYCYFLPVYTMSDILKGMGFITLLWF